MASVLFHGGIPTDADVNTLMQAYANASVGDEIPHADIANAINVPFATTRYRTVVARWRKRMLVKHNLEMKAVPGVGFRVLSASERLDEGANLAVRAFRHVRRASERIALVPENELSTEDRYRKSHTQFVLAKILQSNAEARRHIAPPRPFESGPTLFQALNTPNAG